GVARDLVGDCVGVRSQVVALEIFLAFGAAVKRIPAPDQPHARPVFRKVGVFHRVHFTCIARLSLLIIAVWKPGSTYADRAFPGNLTSTGQLPYSWRLSPLLPN